MKNYLAIDIGASSGRHILGRVEDGKIVLEEVYRFDNSQVVRNGHDCWDIEKLVASVKAGIDAALAKGPVESIGIDTWGVDFVLLDAQGRLVGDAVAYRDARTQGADKEIEATVLSFADLYRRVGLQKAPYNTIYQLWALKKEHPEQLAAAAHFLTVPEYLNYALTGKIVHEYTDSSTTALLDAAKKDWDFDLIEKLTSPSRRATTRRSTCRAARGRSSASRTRSRSRRRRRSRRTSRTRAARGGATASSRTSWASG